MPRGGENAVVPTGGRRVPEGMEAHSNWRDLPVQPEQTEQPDCGPLCALLTSYRAKIGDLKKDLTSLAPYVKTYIYTAEDGNQEGADECEATLRSATSEVEGRSETLKERHLQELEKADAEEKKQSLLLTATKDTNSTTGNSSNDSNTTNMNKKNSPLSEETREKVRDEMERSILVVHETVHGCCRLCMRCMDNSYPSAKDRFGDFNLKLGAFTRKLFGEQRRLLDLIKIIKKEKGVVDQAAAVTNGANGGVAGDSETANGGDMTKKEEKEE